MQRALLLLLLLLLLLPTGSVPMALGDGPGAAALLTEQNPPPTVRGRALRCGALLPAALPGFTALPAQPRALIRAAMALALSGSACSPQAEAEVRGLVRELGPAAAAALLRGLARLKRDPVPDAVALILLSLAQPCAPGTAPTVDPASRSIPGLRCRGAVRRQRGADDACAPPGEQEAHRVLEWVPGISVFYNLGTSIYFGFQGCEALASRRALEAAEDLGYASLAAIAAAAGGPVALGVQMGLQPGLKAGVRALIAYFTSEGEPPTAPSAHSGPVLIV